MKSKTMRLVRSSAVTGLLLAGMAATAASPAHASVGSCGDWDFPENNSHVAQCNLSDPSQVRAVAYCWTLAHDKKTTTYGAWAGRSNGGQSQAFCPSGYEVDGGSYQTQG